MKFSLQNSKALEIIKNLFSHFALTRDIRNKLEDIVKKQNKKNEYKKREKQLMKKEKKNVLLIDLKKC